MSDLLSAVKKVVLALNKLERKFGHIETIEREELCTIGLEIGSDIPFFLHSSPAIVEGRGEKINNLDLDASATVLLLVKPPVAVSTAWAYSLFDQFRHSELTKKHTLNGSGSREVNLSA